MEVQNVQTTDLHPNDYNFNEMDEGQLRGLTATVKKQGYIIHPIIARPDPAGGFVIVDGEHQWRAAQAAGLQAVPVQILADLTEQTAIAETYRRNGLRGNENRLKLARAIIRMKGADGLSNVTTAKMLGKTEGWVRTTLMYAEAADLAANRKGAPSESDIAKLTETDLKEVLDALRQGDIEDAPGANQADGQGEPEPGNPDDDVKPTKVTKTLKALAKMDPAERVEVQKALAKMVKADAKQAAQKATEVVGEAEGHPS